MKEPGQPLETGQWLFHDTGDVASKDEAAGPTQRANSRQFSLMSTDEVISLLSSFHPMATSSWKKSFQRLLLGLLSL